MEQVDDEYRVVRIYDYIIKRELNTTDPFIFGEDIHPGKLESFLNESFNNVKDIHNINDFYYNFFLYLEANCFVVKILKMIFSTKLKIN
ncbi:MAG: hypothetical protein ACTSR7_07075 [Promethearchaeota archaeon]